jgi:hypothetical protein
MLLSQPWLHNAHVTHYWRNNLITIEGNGMMLTIVVTKHLDSNTKRFEVLLCYDLMEGVTDEEEQIFFAIELNLFTFGTITLSELKILNATIFGAKVNTLTDLIAINTKTLFQEYKNIFTYIHHQLESFCLGSHAIWAQKCSTNLSTRGEYNFQGLSWSIHETILG